MSIARWDPFSDMMSLRDAMNDLLAQSFVRPQAQMGQMNTLPLDVAERGNDFIISASLPGVSPNDIDVSVLGDTVRIRGQYSENETFPQGQQGQMQGQQGQSQSQSQGQQSQQGQQGQMQSQQSGQQGQTQNQRWLLRERRFGSFERIVRLPADVNASQAKADYKNGVLTLTLPKAESAREHRIQVGAGAQMGQPQEIEVETGKGGKQQTQAQQGHAATVH